MIIADQLIDESPLYTRSERLRQDRGVKAVGICDVSADLLKDGGEAMIHELYVVLTAVWQSDTFPRN